MWVDSFNMRETIKKSILRRILALQDGYRQNLGVIGPEGIGKTTLLSEIYRELSDQSAFIPILLHAPSLDYEALCEKWIRSLLMGLFAHQNIERLTSIEALLEAADPIIPKTLEKIRHLRKVVARDRPTTTVRELFAMTSSLGEETGKKIILMIDEFHELSTVIEGDVFGLLGKEIMLEKGTTFLMTSSQPRAALEIFREKLSLLFSNFEIFHLPVLSTAECQKFYESSPATAALPKTGREFLAAFCGGFPLYQELIVQRYKEIISLQSSAQDFFRQYADDARLVQLLLQACAEEMVSRQGRLSLLFERRLENQLRSMKEFVLGARILIGVSRGNHKTSEIALALNKKVQDVKKHLSRLEEEGVLVRNGSFYCLEDTLFGFWLREVYAPRYQSSLQECDRDEEKMRLPMDKAYASFCDSAALDPVIRLEILLKKFHRDSVELDGKKYHLPHFHDVALNLSDQGKVVVGRYKEIRWGFQVFSGRVEERDVTAFLLQIKSQKRKFQKKILVALQGIEQNAKLLAHELKIQIWGLKDFNRLLSLYQLPELVIILEEEKPLHETFVGALAQSVYSA
ncbi:MAG: ATP-binding protein [Candidatus Omnitrophica bacterium]|nr:ATP-binding protein [Candidatus Omnitrophota bacterium]